MTEATRSKGRKLVELYRRGVGGERPNAGRLLSRYLREHDLTLYDLDPSLPVTQEVTALDHWRESAAWVARLPQDQDGEFLGRLIDADDLTTGELRNVIDRLDLEKLAQTRLSGWAHSSGIKGEELERAARHVTPDQLLTGSGSLAQRFRESTLSQHWKLTHPERLLRTSDELSQQVVLGLVSGLSGRPGWPDPEGVRAYLDASELARIRAMMAQDLPSLVDRSLRQARDIAHAFASQGQP